MHLQGTRTSYIMDKFWQEKYCPKHNTDGTPRCTACHRLRAAGGDDVVEYEDGRHMCLACLGTMLPDTQAAQDLYHEVCPPGLQLHGYTARLTEAAFRRCADGGQTLSVE